MQIKVIQENELNTNVPTNVDIITFDCMESEFDCLVWFIFC